MQKASRYVFVFVTVSFFLPAGASGAPPRPRKAGRASPLIPVSFDPAAANDPAVSERVGRRSQGSATLRAQVLLDRAHFSPGEIDGAYGLGMRGAVAAFQEARGLRGDGVVGGKTWELLNADAGPVLVLYSLTSEDVAGPFAEIPEDMMEKAKLPALSYESALEGIAERFHASPALLKKLNPGKTFDKAGEEILVPSVESPAPGKAASVRVDGSELAVFGLDPQGGVLARYPATVGSKHDPLPVGSWKIKGAAKKPVFHYNPGLFWDADEAHAKAKIPAGPNNPVGSVWIDLSKEHYGIHGTPEPSTVGKTQSHGCIRLTNWDALELAEMVSPGIPAVLQE